MHIPLQRTSAEIEIKRSRFIAIACAVDSAEHAKATIKAAWDEHPQATHIVYGYQLGKQGDLFGLSDDGEPHGTAGRPVLEVIKGSGITNLLIMVLRYFGGTKLGTGGLVKAYTESAQAVLARLPTEELIDKYSFRIQLPYALYEPVRMMLDAHQASVDGEEFLTEVRLAGTLPRHTADAVRAALQELSAGQVEIEYRHELER